MADHWRVQVATVVGMVADGMTSAEILDAYPDLELDDVNEALRYARGSRFSSMGELAAWLHEHREPPREDDTPVLAGQTGPRRRATREELLALVNEKRARHGLPPAE